MTYLALLAAFAYSAGRILTHAHQQDDEWRKPRRYLLGWDWWHCASALQNLLPLWAFLMLGGWKEKAVFLSLLWLPWVLFRPKHWGKSLWDIRRWWN